MNIVYSDFADLNREEVVALYKANHWSSAEKPEALMNALKNSHYVVTARHNGKLVGPGNAISDGYLVVYYPHMLVLPDYQRKGIGREIMKRLQDRYKDFHQQMLVADGDAVNFYRSCGFVPAGRTESMWVYAGNDH